MLDVTSLCECMRELQLTAEFIMSLFDHLADVITWVTWPAFKNFWTHSNFGTGEAIRDFQFSSQMASIVVRIWMDDMTYPKLPKAAWCRSHDHIFLNFVTLPNFGTGEDKHFKNGTLTMIVLSNGWLIIAKREGARW